MGPVGVTVSVWCDAVVASFGAVTVTLSAFLSVAAGARSGYGSRMSVLGVPSSPSLNSSVSASVGITAPVASGHGAGDSV